MLGLVFCFLVVCVVAESSRYASGYSEPQDHGCNVSLSDDV